jgi:hypothetical protein
MGRSDLIGNGPQHLVPRTDGTSAHVRQHARDETPPLKVMAKKFGHKKLRVGAAVSRKRAG